MFLKSIKIIILFIISLITLGHHSLQAAAMSHENQHDSLQCSLDIECDHSIDIDICNKIESNRVLAIQVFTAPNCTYLIPQTVSFSKNLLLTYNNEYKRIPISHSQLARSHLY